MIQRITIQNAGYDAAPVIERLISTLPDGGTLVFDKGCYPLYSAIHVQGKKGLTIKGNGCTLAPIYDRTAAVEKSAEVFHFQNCQDVTIQDIEIDSQIPANSAGTITNVTSEFADVQMNSRVPFDGREQFISGMTFDEDGLPTYHYWLKTDSDPTLRTVIADEIACTAPRALNVPHEMIDDQLVRVWSKNLNGLEPGMRCSVSHSYYGLTACVFRQCDRFIFEDVTISNYGGFGFTILPRCRDFIFRRLRMVSADPIHQPFALNADGIHITGLSGRLLLEDCQFDSLGDDLLNIHTQVMTVRECDGDTMQVYYDKPHGIVSPHWVAPGDVLRVYCSATLDLRAEVRVKACKHDSLVLEADAAAVQPGDYITNQAYFPDVIIRRCKARNFRGRAFVLQSVNCLTIEDCVFEGVATCALYCSTAFDKWMEAGPVRNVTIQGNRFYGNGQWLSPTAGQGAIWIRVNGERHQNIAPIHQNVVIADNVFEEVGGTPIIVHLTDGVQVRNNVFVHCGTDSQHIVIERCTNVLNENNHSL